MFSKALKQIDQFTFPVIISTLHFSGEVKAGCGTFIFLNPEGWVLTACHVMAPMLNYDQHKQEIDQYEKAKARLESDKQIPAKHRKKGLAKLHANPNWITNISYWWGQNGIVVHEFHWDTLLDIAVCRLEPFNPSDVHSFPTFLNPDEILPPGTSLCRQGFPLS